MKLNSRVTLRETAESVIALPTMEAVKNYYIFEKTIGTTDFNFNVNTYNAYSRQTGICQLVD